jgi:excisionase family DNA binding protein
VPPAGRPLSEKQLKNPVVTSPSTTSVQPVAPARTVLLPGLDPLLAAHVSTALVRYRKWLGDVDRPLPAGFAELLASTIRVASNGQLRRSAHLVGDHARMGCLLSLDQAAQFVGVSQRTLRRRAADGTLRVRRIGRRVLVHPGDLIDLIEAS